MPLPLSVSNTPLYPSCQVLRMRVVIPQQVTFVEGVPVLTSGAPMSTLGVCGTPLDDSRQESAQCPACARGWSSSTNRFATEDEISRYAAQATSDDLVLA